MSIHGEIRAWTREPLGAGLAHLIHRAGSTLRRLPLFFQRRRMIGQLLQLDDHMLRDMGLSRADVLDAASGPVWRDPSRLLVARAVERRSAAWLGGRKRT